MLATLAGIALLGQQAKTPKVEMHDPATFKADFNKAKGVPRVVIILSPS